MFKMILMEAAADTGGLMQMLPLVVVLGGMFFFMNRSQKKQQKEAQQLRDSLEVGDEIITVGGIVGIVVKIEETTILIETGADRSKIRVTKSAVGQNTTQKERIEAARAAARDAKASKKEEKK